MLGENGVAWKMSGEPLLLDRPHVLDQSILWEVVWPEVNGTCDQRAV